MLDRLPPAARHAAILCILAPLVAAVGVLTSAVLAVSGVGVDWATAGRSALDVAAVTLATGIGTWVTLWVTPLVRSYGPGSKPQAIDSNEGED